MREWGRRAETGKRRLDGFRDGQRSWARSVLPGDRPWRPDGRLSAEGKREGPEEFLSSIPSLAPLT
jgi:hypothetical protein